MAFLNLVESRESLLCSSTQHSTAPRPSALWLLAALPSSIFECKLKKSKKIAEIIVTAVTAVTAETAVTAFPGESNKAVVPRAHVGGPALQITVEGAVSTNFPTICPKGIILLVVDWLSRRRRSSRTCRFRNRDQL